MAATNPPKEKPWAIWLRDQLRERGWQPVEITRLTGGQIGSSTISRWLDSKREPDPASIRKVCAALGVPPADGLLAAGIVEPEDIGATVVQAPDLGGASDQALIDELAGRLAERHRQDGADVTELRPWLRPETLGQEWAARHRPPQK